MPDSSILPVIAARRFHALLATAAVLLAIAMVRSAWLCDDALISLRTIDHFVNGDGLRFNLDARVQAFTHPLWRRGGGRSGRVPPPANGDRSGS